MASLKDFTLPMYLQLKAEDQSVVDQLLTDHLVFLQPQEKLDAVIRKFHGAKIISAPIKLQNGTYSFVTLLDIVTAIEDIADPVIFDIPIENFCRASGITDFAIIKTDKNLFDVAALLADKHRILIVDDEEKPVSVFSQFDLISFVVKHPQYIPEKLHHIPAGHVMTTNPATVKLTDKVMDAFKICADKRYHGIAVVNDQNEIAGSLSISSLQYLTPDNFKSLLSLTVGRFLEETQHYHKLPVFVHYGDHLDTVAKTMRNNHIHRVFVCDDNKKPIGVISSTDLVSLMASAILERERTTATGV